MSRLLRTLAAAALLCVLSRGSCNVGPQDTAAGREMTAFRLPTAATRPESYELRFVPELRDGATSTFSGVANITVTALSAIDTITLNLRDLDVTAATVMDVELRRDVPVDRLVYRTGDEQLEIRLGKSVPAGRKYLVTVRYGGKIRTDDTGLYTSSYTQSGGVTKWLAVTQFEPVYARRAFPCYDEPEYKAVFNVSVVKKKNQIALSNMPIREIIPGQHDTEVVYFKSTPPMSSYLLAIYVGEFVPNKVDSHITIYTHKEYINQTSYIEAEAPKHLNVLSDYTGIEYMLPKMDLLAVPGLSFGAMENWGINTYREKFLLLHEETKTKMKMIASTIVQHEFTHQWFGNLVTCAWWDYTWLNEGFAQYFQYFATKLVRTNWPVEEMFLIEAHQSALSYDQTPRHPITTSVNTPDEIDDVFDWITYKKAASVLRMLRYLVTEELFQLSLRDYLNNYREKYVAKPEDLFASFDSVLYDKGYMIGNGLSVHVFMSNWTLQSGYPVLNIAKNETTNTYSVTQSRFLVKPTRNVGNNTDRVAWHVGLTFTTETDKNFTHTRPSFWTDKTSESTVVPAPPNSGWYVFNVQSSGFYRVNYDTDNWMALIEQLDKAPTEIHVLNRAQLISDSFNLALAGQLNYTVPLYLSKYLRNENSITPWYSAQNCFSYLLERMPCGSLKTYVSRLAGIIYNDLETRVASGDDDYYVKSAWDAFSKWACDLDNKDCTTRALEYFNKWQAGERIPADIKDAAFCVGIKNNTDPGTFDKMFDLYTTTTSISEKMSIESALGCSANRTQLYGYINHILDGPQGPIKVKDFGTVISSVASTPLGLDVLHEFLSTNLNRILNELPNGQEIVTSMYSTLATKVTNNIEIENLQNLKNTTTVPESVRQSFDESFKKINDHQLWLETYSQEISQWVLENQEPVIEDTSTTTAATTSTTEIKSTETESLGTSIIPSSTVTPKLSSATSTVQNGLTVLLFAVTLSLGKNCVL